MWKSDHGQNILFSIKLVHGFVSRNWLLAGHPLTPEAPLGEPGRQVKGGTCRYEEREHCSGDSVADEEEGL